MRPISDVEGWLQTTRITPRAMQGLEELPRLERDATLDVLRAPFREARTEKMVQRRDLDLWRVRVNRDVRITYRLVDGRPLIVHIGRHSASDWFVAHTRGQDEAGPALEEVEAMKALKIEKVSVVPAVLPMSNPRPPADDLLRLLTNLIAQVVRDEQQAGKDLALDEVDRLTAAVKELEDQLTQVQLDREDAGQGEQLRALMAQARAEAEGRHKADEWHEVRETQSEMHHRLDDQQRQLDEQARRVGQTRGNLQAQVNELSNKVTELSEAVRRLMEREEVRQRGWWHWLTRMWTR